MLRRRKNQVRFADEPFAALGIGLGDWKLFLIAFRLARANPGDNGIDLIGAQAAPVDEMTEFRARVPGRHASFCNNLRDHAGLQRYLLVGKERERRRGAGAMAFLAVLAHDRRDMLGEGDVLFWRPGFWQADHAAVNRRFLDGDLAPRQHGVDCFL